jgi:hypothetical protein
MLWMCLESSKYAPLFRTAMKFGPELVIKKKKLDIEKSNPLELQSSISPAKTGKKKRAQRVALRLNNVARVFKTIEELDQEEKMKTMAAGTMLPKVSSKGFECDLEPDMMQALILMTLEQARGLSVARSATGV